MLDPIDPVFEQSLQEITATVKVLTRGIAQAAVDCEVRRIRRIVASYEDHDLRSAAQLVDLMLDEIGGGDLEGA